MRKILLSQKQQPSLMQVYSEMFGDVLLRHRASAAERAKRIEAERLNAAKSHFIANMSHELRTPLNAIIGFSKLIASCEKNEIDPGQVIEYASYIHETSEHLLDIINDLLDLSKIQAEKQTIDIEDILISEVLTSCLNIIKLDAKEKKIDLNVSIEENLPYVPGEAVKLKQIFANILSNAVKFSPLESTISISAKTITLDKIAVTIADQGPGMTPEEIEIALTPFGQVEHALNRENSGTGLGLPIAKALVELHGGKFKIESAQNRGTTVHIMLPCKTDNQTVITA